MAWVNNSNKTALLVDGANCYEAGEHIRCRVDYAKVLKLFSPRQAYYFTALPVDDRENDPNYIFKIIDYLQYNGYSLVTKPMKVYDNGGILTKKGNMDVEIALYMMKVVEWADHIVLMSGDGDFRSVVEEAQMKGVKVTVISALKCNPPMVADELRRQANQFIDMCDSQWRDTMRWRGE